MCFRWQLVNTWVLPSPTPLTSIRAGWSSLSLYPTLTFTFTLSQLNFHFLALRSHLSEQVSPRLHLLFCYLVFPSDLILFCFVILSSLQTELHPWLPHDLCGHTPSPPAEGWDDGHSQDGSWTLTSRHFFGWNCQLLNIPVRWFGPVSVLLRYVTKEVMALWKNDGIKWSQIRSHLSQPCDASICHPRLHLSRSMLGLINILFFHWHRTTKLCNFW